MRLALAIVAAAFVSSLRDPFLSDDYILVSRATLDSSRILAVFHTPGGDGSFRPLGYLYFGLLHYFGGVEPWKWHAFALAVHLVNCALLYGIVWSATGKPAGGPAADQGVRPTLVAFLAAVLFGLNGTRPETVAWTAGNFDLLACAFTLAATLAVLRGRVWLALPLLVLGILSKESAYAAPAVIFGFAAAAGRLRESRIRAALIGSMGICTGVCSHTAGVMFHGPGGYVNPVTGQPQVFSFHLGSALKALFLRVWANLLFPINWDASAKSAILAVALAGGAGLALYAALATRLPPPHRALGARTHSWCAAACLSPGVDRRQPERVADPILAGDRHLRALRAFGAIEAGRCDGADRLYGMHPAAQSGRMASQRATLADQVCAGATNQAPVHDLNGVVFFANGYKECVEMKNLPRR